ncbi:hypothetical protein Rsub_10619 [Raphidocelis subcapitata]|uniref:Protein kinase domain-containing protein n=1 Tax=Raphidocelis subcapitata TaxID=307507 RepID=A0A2V0PDM5_9CHLO|nr:hypothetical protein Rsub_10619 [Raphidocelis subcapitata]|eukprot:GBF97946.1 hypothetical protein Rsub_10619 [Raphidocelis subcapitata]
MATAYAPPQSLRPRQRRLAQFAPCGGFFGVGGWRPGPVPILTAAAAARELGQASPHATLLWLDEARAQLVVSLRGAAGAVESHPLRHGIKLAAPGAQAGACCSVSFEERAGREAVQQLTRHALPSWERICEDAAQRCLAVAGGSSWVVRAHDGGDTAAVALERADGGAKAVVALDVQAAQVLLCAGLGCGDHSPVEVRSLDDSLRALARWCATRQHAPAKALAAVAALQHHPAAAGDLRKALAAVPADEESLGGWLNAGLVPALIDHAAACKAQPLPAAHGADQRHGQEHRHAAEIATLIARAGARGAQQARLALRCLCSRLDAGGAEAAAPLLELLAALLRYSADPDAAALGGSEFPVAGRLLAVAVASSGALLEVLQSLYARLSWHLPAAELLPKLNTVGTLPSHVIRDEAEGLPPAAAAALASASARGGSLASLLRSPAPSEPGSPARRPSVVPRLSLPVVAVASTPGSVSRRSLAERRSSARGGGSTDRGGEPNMLALQRVGFACGQSAMCADLAAFAAHKQAHGASGAGSGRSSDCGAAPPAAAGRSSGGDGRPNVVGSADASDGSTSGEDEESDAPASAAAGGIANARGSAFAAVAVLSRRELPDLLRAKLLLLLCLGRISECYARARRAPPLTPINLLVSELLVAEADMASRCPPDAARRCPAAAVALGVAGLRRLSARVVAAYGRLAASERGGWDCGRPSGGARDSRGSSAGGGDDTLALDARPKQHDDIITQLRQRLARIVGRDRDALRDPGLLAACYEPLLVLDCYLAAAASPALADAAACDAAEPLARLENAIRAVQPRFLQPDALRALSALARVYARLLRLGGRAGATQSWLMAALGCGAPGGGAVPQGAADAVCASDTLQFLLDVLRTRPYYSSGGGAAGSQPPSASPGRPAPRRSAAGGGPSRLGASDGGGAAAAAPAAAGAAAGIVVATPQSGALARRDEARLRLWLWRYLTELLGFALRHPNVKPLAAPQSGGWFPPSADGSVRGSSLGGASPSAWAPGLLQASPAASRAGSLAGGRLDADGGIGGFGGGFGAPTASMPGSGLGHALVQLLADELLRSRGGRSLAVRHLEDSAGCGGRGALAVHLQVLSFIRAMAAAPASPLLSSPQLADSFVHLHFLQFVRLYHSALSQPCPAAPAAAAAPGAPEAARRPDRAALRACRGHLGVLLEIAGRAPGGGAVRRRFLQLHVLDFLLRELALEHGLRHQAALSSRTVSSYGTPASTTRQLSSRRSSRTGAGGAGSSGGLAGLAEGAGGAPGEQLCPVEEHDAAGCSSPAAAGPIPPALPPTRAGGDGESAAAAVSGQHSSPLRGRRLAPIAADAGALEAAEPAGGSPQVPRPPEGPSPFCPSPPRRAPTATPLAAPPRAPQQPPASRPLRPPPAPHTWITPPASPGLGEGGSTGSGSDASPSGPLGSPRTPRADSDGGGGSGACTPRSAASPLRMGGSDGGSGRGSGSATPEPPQPTGDLSEDLAAIEEWEARTGRVYQFGGLSDAEDEAPATDGSGRGGPSASPSPEPARRGGGGAVPRLTLGADRGARGPQLQLPPRLAGGWGGGGGDAPVSDPPAKACGGAGTDADAGSDGQLPDSPGSGSSYRPGYDLEEDFARGYLAQSPGSDRSGASGASSGASSLIPAGVDGGAGGAAAGGREWGSSSGSSRGAGGGASDDGSQADGGDGGGRAGASPARRGPLVPALNLSAKLLPTSSPGPAVPEPGARGPGQAPAGAESQQEGAATGAPALQEGVAARLARLVASDCGGGGSGSGAAPVVDAALASYRARRQARLIYHDPALHASVLRLAASLLLAPDGRLDPLALPQDTTDSELQRHASVLREHLSHPDNAAALAALRAAAEGADGGGPGWAAGLRRLLRLTAAGMFDAGRYARERGGQMASGAYGSLLKATMRHPSLAAPLPVVLKSVSLDASGGRHDVCSFERAFGEVAALEALAGVPGVVPLLDYGAAPDGSAVQLVFPRYDCSLSAWRRRRPARLGAGDVRLYLSVFAEMVRTVGRLHAAGVVHFDIKGDNFLTAPAAEGAAIAAAVSAVGRRGGGGGGGGGGDGGAAAAPAPAAARVWPPRPPELPPAGGPRRPGRAAARGHECSSGSGGTSRSGGCRGCCELPIAVVLADFGEAAIFSGGHTSDSHPGGGGGHDGPGADGGAPAAPGAAAPSAAAAFTARHRGSAAFMSPEMHMLGSGTHAREHAHYDRRRLRGAGPPHDVWSLGCCLYELLVGAPLFADEAEPALRVGAALEADARRRAAARAGGELHRQASVLSGADAGRLAALLPPELALPMPAAAAAEPAEPAPDAAAAAAAPARAGWLQPRRQRKAKGAAPQLPPAGAQARVKQQQQQQEAAAQQGRYGGVAGALLELLDTILVLDAVHRPGTAEVAARVARVLEALPEGP